MLHFAEIPVGTGSVRACRLCGAVGQISFSTIKDIAGPVERCVQEWSHGPGPNLALTGPDAFDHPELPGIVAYAVQVGVRRLRLETRGDALRLPGNAPGAIDAGVRHVRFVVHAADADLDARMSGTPSGMAMRTEGAARLAAAIEERGVRVHVSALVPVCRHNARELPAIVGHAVALGARSVVLAVGDGCKVAPEVLEAACDSGTVNGVWVTVEGPAELSEEYRVHGIDTLPLPAEEGTPDV